MHTDMIDRNKRGPLNVDMQNNNPQSNERTLDLTATTHLWKKGKAAHCAAARNTVALNIWACGE